MNKQLSAITRRFAAVGAVFFLFGVHLTDSLRVAVICLKSFTAQGGAGDAPAFLLHHEAELWVSRKLKQ